MIRWLSVIWRTRRYRSLVGIALALVILPAVLGILACLKTPVGDPERSRTDPRLTGIWLSGDPGPSDRGAVIWIFEPYDARTWLMTRIDFGHAPDTTAAAASPSAGVDVLHILAELGEHPPRAASVTLCKAWLAQFGGQRFLVLEPKAQPTSRGEFQPEVWVLYRVRLEGPRIVLSSLKEATEDLDKTKSRKEAEQIIARHAAEAEFYERPETLSPIPRAGYDDVHAILKHIGFD